MDRVACDLPDCHRTIGADRYRRQFKHEPGNWWCPAHWRLVPRSVKRVKARHEREWRRYGFYPREEAYRRVVDVCWRYMAGLRGLGT